MQKPQKEKLEREVHPCVIKNYCKKHYYEKLELCLNKQHYLRTEAGYVSILQLWCHDPKGWICALLAYSAEACSKPSTDTLQHCAEIHQGTLYTVNVFMLAAEEQMICNEA